MYGGGADVKAARSDLEVFSLEGNCLQRLELQKNTTMMPSKVLMCKLLLKI